MPTLNLGIVAHVDAGKTTLTERLLYETGVSNHLGRVDHGDTITDADALERRRGITIRSAVVAFTIGELKVNLIDTPGHSDFVAEVERALAVLDGAVLVVSAVEGVQSQTRVLIRILERLQIPFLIFANKIDRVGAAYEQTMTAIREAVSGDAVALTRPVGLGSRAATVESRRGPDFAEDLTELLAEYDDDVLRRYVVGPPMNEPAIWSALAHHTSSGQLHPVCFGSALAGIGVTDLIEMIPRLLPAAAPLPSAALRATVFKVERPAAGHAVAYARLYAGTLNARDHVSVHHRSSTGVLTDHQTLATHVETFRHGAVPTAGTAHAGDIATISGLNDLAIGDQLGGWDASRGGRYFPPPGLEAVVQPRDPEDRRRLFVALQQLSEQDPLIDARLDGLEHEITVSVYGEVQKEVIAYRLESEYGVAADVLPTRTVCVERVTGVGEARDQVRTGNASLGLRVEPGPVGSGLEYVMAVERGYLLPSFHVAIEEALTAALEHGVFGWRVTDCRVTLVHGRFCAPTPPAGYYRDLATTVLAAALAQARTTVCTPVSEFEAEIPAAALRQVLQLLHVLGATPEPPVVSGSRGRIAGMMATDRVDLCRRRLPGLTQGEGVLLVYPAGYEPVLGPPPMRHPPVRVPKGPGPVG